MTNDEKIYRDIIHSVGLNNHLPDKVIKDIIDSQYKFIYNKIRETKFDNLTYEEIDELKTSFLLKYIGKIYTDSNIIKRIHNRKSFVKKLKEEHELQQLEEGRCPNSDEEVSN